MQFLEDGVQTVVKNFSSGSPEPKAQSELIV